MEILLYGLGPNDSISCNGMIYRNGDTVTMDDEFAQSYIGAKLAVAAQPGQAAALQKLETKNAARREAIRDKAQKEDG